MSSSYDSKMSDALCALVEAKDALQALVDTTGIKKSNVVAALRGRRPIPRHALPLFQNVLGLGPDGKLDVSRLHVLVMQNITPEVFSWVGGEDPDYPPRIISVERELTLSLRLRNMFEMLGIGMLDGWESEPVHIGRKFNGKAVESTFFVGTDERGCTLIMEIAPRAFMHSFPGEIPFRWENLDAPPFVMKPEVVRNLNATTPETLYKTLGLPRQFRTWEAFLTEAKSRAFTPQGLAEMLGWK